MYLHITYKYEYCVHACVCTYIYNIYLYIIYVYVYSYWILRALNGPSARSGHRMVHMKKQLIVFGGFHDNLRHDYKYFNDVHIFDLETYMWRKIEPAGKKINEIRE